MLIYSRENKPSFISCLTIHLLCNLRSFSVNFLKYLKPIVEYILHWTLHCYGSTWRNPEKECSSRLYTEASLTIQSFPVKWSGMLQCFPSNILPFWCSLTHELILAPKRHVQNIIPAYFQVTGTLFMPQTERKSTNILQDYCQRSLLVYSFRFSDDIYMSSLVLSNDLKMVKFFLYSEHYSPNLSFK